MNAQTIEERLKQVTLLSREEQFQLRKDILAFQPQILRPWWWFHPCEVNVLLVVDGLDFSVNVFGLSTFVTIFKKMEMESFVYISYKVTLANRLPGDVNSPEMMGGDPNIHNRITSFRFDNPAHFSQAEFDQVWLFGISPDLDLDNTEVAKIEEYMNKGGGLFATGDHGSLGKGMCGKIPRVKDMRIWDDTDPNQTVNEVSMDHRRRNDTNQPQPGDVASTNFADQSDNIPQRIYPKFYGPEYGPLLPHPILSINPAIKPNGVIDIMPDHPHEGQCKEETIFTVTNLQTGVSAQIPTQNISTALVVPGNTAGYKEPTDGHCFPSIGVFDGRPENVGRIVVDATWHHFVNINLQGLDPGNYGVIEQYFKNISRWISRSKIMICLIKRLVVEALFTDRVIEASLSRPEARFEEIPLRELFTIGKHVIDVVSQQFNPVEGELFALSVLELQLPEVARKINPWGNQNINKNFDISNRWINPEALSAIGIGAGVIKLRDEIGEIREPINQILEDQISNIFDQGMAEGLELAIQQLETQIEDFSGLTDQIVRYTYLIEGTIRNADGSPASGLTVRAVDQDFPGESLLGGPVQTEGDGKYTIPYKETDFLLGGRGEDVLGPDIILYVYNAKGEQIHKSETILNAPEKVVHDITL